MPAAPPDGAGIAAYNSGLMSRLRRFAFWANMALGISAGLVAVIPIAVSAGVVVVAAITGSAVWILTALVATLGLISLGLLYRLTVLERRRRNLYLRWLRAASNSTVVRAALELTDEAAATPGLWLPDPRDLSTLELDDDNLINLAREAREHFDKDFGQSDVRFANMVLMVVSNGKVLATAPWIGFVGSGARMPKTAALTFRGSAADRFAQDWTLPQGRPAGSSDLVVDPWLEDPTWKRLITKSWRAVTTVKGEPGTRTGFEGAVVLSALPRWSRGDYGAWRISYRAFDREGPNKLPIDYALRGDVLKPV